METYIKEITSSSNKMIKDFSKLKEKKYREEEKMFIVEGDHLVNEAFNAKRLKIVFARKKEDLNRFENVEKYIVSDECIKKLSQTSTPQGIVGICNIENRDINYKNIKHILILDGVKDPGNVGTLIRTSLAFDVDLICLSSDSCDIYNDKVVRSSQGAIFNIPIVYRDLSEEILKMRENDIKIISTSLKSNLDIRNIEKIDKYALILGNEANGVRENIMSLADMNVIINISKKMESLNVAIAGAIILYEVSK